MSWLPDAERPCCQTGAVGAAAPIAYQGGGMVASTEWRHAVMAGGCCCCKATCKWRGLEVVLSLALPVAELLVAELPRGTEIWRLKNIGSFRTSSIGMALVVSKRWGCKALTAVTYPASLAGNCRQLMLTVLKRMVAPYANARVCGALDRWCSWNTFHAKRSGSSKRDTTLAWRAWICVGTSTSPTPLGKGARSW